MDVGLVNLSDISGIIRRKKWYFLIPALLVLIVGWTVTLRLPPAYYSEATILIERPNVTPDLVTPIIKGYAVYRVEAIAKRVMTTQNLAEIVRRHNLYASYLDTNPESLVWKLKEDSGFYPISAENKKNFAPDTVIAFTIWFEYGDPKLAQAVVSDLVDLFLAENERERREAAADSVAFFVAAAERADHEIAAFDEQIALLKQEHAGSLPSDAHNNAMRISLARDQLRDLDFRQQLLRERETYLASELRTTSPTLDSEVIGEKSVLDQQIDALAAKYAQETGRLAPGHPVLADLQRQIAALTASRSNGQSGTRAAKRLPNPAYNQLQDELAQVRMERTGLERQAASTRELIAGYEQRLATTPEVERKLQEIERGRAAVVERQKDIQWRRSLAELGESVEATRKGERFMLSELPTLPGEPSKPKRRVIMFMVAALAFGCGIATLVLAELLDSSVHGARRLGTLVGMPPLLVLPVMKPERAIHSHGMMARLTSAAGALVFLAAAAVIGLRYQGNPQLERMTDQVFDYITTTITPLWG